MFKSLKEAVGQLFMVGFEGDNVPVILEGSIRRGRVGGVVLFRRNMVSLDGIRAMNSALQGMVREDGYPLLIGVDQEGGKVQRIGEDLGVKSMPSAMWFSGQSLELCRQYSDENVKLLRDLGFNVNFAPVLDIHSCEENPIIGERAYGRDAETVSRYGCEVVRSHLEGGVIPCGKHFPGHGDTVVDSHLSLPVVEHDLERLRSFEFLPFQAAVSAGVPMIMTGHLLMKGLGDTVCASFSSRVIRELLRGELGFEGVVVSDDLEMGAVTDYFGVLNAVIMGLFAGVDLFLICKRHTLWYSVFDQLVSEAEGDKSLQDCIYCAAERVVELKKKFLVNGR